VRWIIIALTTRTQANQSNVRVSENASNCFYGSFQRFIAQMEAFLAYRVTNMTKIERNQVMTETKNKAIQTAHVA
jgi:hypothetical protein